MLCYADNARYLGMRGLSRAGAYRSIQSVPK